MSKTLKVGIDVSQIVYSTGVSDYTVNLVKSLQQTGPQLQLTLFGASLRRISDIKSIFPQAKTFPFPPTFLHYLWNVLHIIPVETFIGKVDVFHASDWAQPPSLAPSVTTVHDLSPILFPGEMGPNIVSVHTSRLNRAIKQCRKIICVSKSTAVDMQHIFKIDSSRLEVIPEALPARFDLDPSNADVQKLKSKWHLSDYLISVGTPQPRKNYPRLVSSFLKFQSKYRLPQKLVIVGGGGWGNQIPSHPAIIETGFLPDGDVASLVQGAQALVLPSLYEGFGLPILLAWRQRVPVVTSDVSSLPEVAGEAAVLIDPKDEESIAAGVAKAIASHHQLVTSGSARLKIFNWPDIADKTYSLYQSLC